MGNGIEVGSVIAPLAQDAELVGDFLIEAHEHLGAIESSLLELERGADSGEAVHAAFRSFHTLKGLAGFLEMDAIQRIAHEVETLLDLARNGELALAPDIIDLILDSKDAVSRQVADIEAGGSGKSSTADEHLLMERVRAVISAPDPELGPALASPLGLEALSAAMQATEQDASGNRAPSPEPAPQATARTTPANETRSVKVDTGKLDHLVDMVGEMVIAQSLLRHDPEIAAAQSRLARNLSQLARITSEVQKTAMSMRMVPVGQLFQKMARLVRDLARKTNKEAIFEAAGEETELDRNIVEELADPLMHMVRNAVDHGLEPPDERIRSGKPAAGRIRLCARHEAGHVVIEIRDDGRGLGREKILRKAREKGLVDEGRDLPDTEVFDLIFHPGFSTAEQVTAVSGRGVGMDVVRKQLQKLRGRVHVRSSPGAGSSFEMRLPLTLAIIDGLVVGVGQERYVVPVFAVREMLRPSEEMITGVQGAGETALVRGQILPMIRLHRRFGVEPKSVNPWEGLLLVAESSRRRFCVLVDSLLGKQEVVIKSLGERLRDIPGVAGGAILADGRVGLILDLDGLFHGGSGGRTLAGGPM